MIIYTSEKVMPYVYMGTHKDTGEFYIGYRSTQRLKLPSHQDLFEYRTSSKRVKPRFDEFDWVIVAEFFDSVDAYEFEQQLIYEYWDNPLKLNSVCHFNSKRHFINNRAGVPRSAETKKKISIAKTGKPRGPVSDDTRALLSANRRARGGRPHTPETRAKLQAIADARRGTKQSDETKLKKSIAGRGRKHTEESKQKMSDSKKGKPTKGTPCTEERKNQLRGRVVSEETKQKIRDTKARVAKEKRDKVV